nr:hypothetical protein [Bacteroidales bacterium]
EWIKKYPDEYNAVNGSTSEADFESRQNFLESVKDTERDLYLEELERLKKSAPEFYYRHLDWLQGTDPALYRKLIKQN